MISTSRRRVVSMTAVSAMVWGGAVALHYYRLGLTLSHYDARGHLVVARRIIDSITPGWQQIGAVWLPLPHLLNFLPVQIDALYRSGASAVAISIVAFGVASGAIAWIVASLTGSGLAAAIAAAVFALNPNVLYLQATPMTEPLLIATMTVAVAMMIEGIARLKPRATAAAWSATTAVSSARLTPSALGIAFALACLTRYEAWFVTAAALVLGSWARWRQGAALSPRELAPIAVYPAFVAVTFVVFSRIVIGQWFVSTGFFVPENKALGDPVVSAAEIVWGVRMLSGYPTLLLALAGLLLLAIMGLLRRDRSAGVIVFALIAAAVLPFAAFVNGHPFRIRYMVPLLAAEAVGVGAAAGIAGRFRTLVAVAVICAAAYDLRPLDRNAPMVVEAQWDQPNVPVRQNVTDCLRAAYDGDKIMASMGSLGHYMQAAARDGFRIRDFLHEGNGDIWLASLDGPRPFVGWVLIEEKANGGDMLARIARRNPRFLEGYVRVCEGAGLALYKRAQR